MQSSLSKRPRVKRFPDTPSLDVWLSHSVTAPMASTNDENSFDDNASSLGDSSYDFLDDRSAVTTDDEGSSNLTLSFSSSDGPESETPIVSRSQNTDLARGHGRTSQLSDHGNTNDTSDEDQGSHILQEEHRGIMFDEAPIVRDHPLRIFAGSHTIKEYDSHEIQDVLECGSSEPVPKHLKLTVRQTMAAQELVPPEPFRIMYTGDPAVKEPIVQKFGSILAAFSRAAEKTSSRFNVVPISSFGHTRSPEVLLVDSVGLEISVKDCVSASLSGKEDGMNSICLKLSDDTLVTSRWSPFESSFEVLTGLGERQLPQIAVLYLSNKDTMAAKQTRRLTQSFMSRHRIPCLMIAETQLHARAAEAATLDYLAPHLCFETSDVDQTGPNIIIKRFPLDLSTFLELDATQLNRNLALLMELNRDIAIPEKSPSKERSIIRTLAVNAGATERQTEDLKPMLWQDIKKEAHRYASQNQAFTIGSLMLLLLLSMIASMILGFLTISPGDISQYGLVSPAVLAGSSVRTVEPTKLSAESTLTTTASTTGPLQTHASRLEPTVKPNTDLAAFLLDSHALTPNNSAKFKVHVVGDCHIVLRPPHWFMRYRKAPKLLFNVTRNNAALEHELTMLFDGVYALRILREEAHGVVNVSVRTISKPKINEVFQVDFGNHWLKAAGWKKAARSMTESLREDLDLVHNGLSTVYSHASSEIQVFVHDAVRKADTVRKEMDRLRRLSINHTVRSTDLMLGQTKDISLSISAKARNSTSALSRHVALYNRHLRKDLALYLETKKVAIKTRAQLMSRSVKEPSIRNLAWTTDRLRGSHLRLAQKEALKAWWKVVGAPKQTPTGVSHACKTRKRGLYSTKKSSR